MQEITFETATEHRISKEFFGGTDKEQLEKMQARLRLLDTTFAAPNRQEKIIQVRREKIGRNDPCPCMSGKKFKKCCISKMQ